jgi:hypothetical protein
MAKNLRVAERAASVAAQRPTDGIHLAVGARKENDGKSAFASAAKKSCNKPTHHLQGLHYE